MAKYTEKKKESNRKWDADNLDRISVALPKGRKEQLQLLAKKNGMSVNGYINSLIDIALEQNGDSFHIADGSAEPKE